jgi:HK97 family phage major capsid protein
MKPQTRTLSIDATRADQSRRIVPAVISSEYPVERDGYTEVLLHGSDNVDLSRAPLPLIESHDGRKLNIGLVDNLRLSEGKLRGDIVFGSSARANELWPDVKDGIVRSLSIGYEITDYRERGATLEATRWRPHEASLVSIPADPTAGTYRSLNPMYDHDDGQPAADAGERLSRGQRRALNGDRAQESRVLEAERERVSEIQAIARSKYIRDAVGSDQADAQADDAVSTGMTVDAFRKAMLAAAESTQPNAGRALRPLASHYGSSLSAGRTRQFSIARAIGGVLDPKGIDNGYERECSQELARQMGRQPKGFYMPVGRLAERVFNVTGAPAMVGTEHLGSEFIDVLRARSFVMQLGTRVLSGLTQDVSIPRLTTSASSGWIAGDGADGLTPSDPELDSVTLSPKAVGALTVLSRKMILQGDPDSENMVRNDLAQLIAVELDRAAINGSGTSNQPLGVVGTSGILTDTYPLAGPDFASIVAMEDKLAANNADLGNLAYLTTPALAATLKSTQKAPTSSEFIWAAGRDRGTGEMNGFPAFATSNMVSDKLLFGNWNDLLMGVWGAIDIEVDPYYDFAKGSIAVRVLAYVDFAVRHPESFALYSRSST